MTKSILMKIGAVLSVAALSTTLSAQSDSVVVGDGGANGSSYGREKSAYTSTAYSSGSMSTTSISSARKLDRYLKKHSDTNSGRAYAVATSSKANVEVHLRYDGDIVKTASAVAYSARNGTISRSLDWSRQLDIFPYDPSVSIPVGPVVVTFGGNAGVGIEVKASASANVGTLYAHSKNSTAVWIYGRAFTIIGIPGFGVGVQANLVFAKTILGVTMSAASQHVSASGSYLFLPMSVKIRPFIWVVFKIYGPTLAKFSTGWTIKPLF